MNEWVSKGVASYLHDFDAKGLSDIIRIQSKKKFPFCSLAKNSRDPVFFTKLTWTHSNFRVANLRLAKPASNWLESAESQMSELDSCNLKKSTWNIGFKRYYYQITKTFAERFKYFSWCWKLTLNVRFRYFFKVCLKVSESQVNWTSNWTAHLL
mgnify:CR=1 FL=1